MKARPVYKRLEWEMMKEGIDTYMLADLLKISYHALRARLRGDTVFYLDEAIDIHSILGREMTLEELFERETA